MMRSGYIAYILTFTFISSTNILWQMISHLKNGSEKCMISCNILQHGTIPTIFLHIQLLNTSL